jgi:hypothetical protein
MMGNDHALEASCSPHRDLPLHHRVAYHEVLPLAQGAFRTQGEARRAQEDDHRGQGVHSRPEVVDAQVGGHMQAGAWELGGLQLEVALYGEGHNAQTS